MPFDIEVFLFTMFFNFTFLVFQTSLTHTEECSSPQNCILCRTRTAYFIFWALYIIAVCLLFLTGLLWNK